MANDTPTVGDGSPAEGRDRGRRLRTASTAAGDPMEPEEVTGEQFRMYRVAAGHLRLDYPNDAKVTGQDARDVLQAFASLTNGSPTPLLVDVRKANVVLREARKTFASTTFPSRVALLVESPLSRVLANFFIAVSSPSIPTKMFTDLNAAQRWLLDGQ